MSRSHFPSRASRWRAARGAVALIAAVGLAAGGLAACASPGAGPDSSADAKDSLSLAIPGGSTGTVLDPHVALDPMSTTFGWTFFEDLGTRDANGVYSNFLAESFTPNADATSWTMTLKDGITFHSGKPLTADDVIFSFNRILDPATAATAAGPISVISSMTKIDDKTVQFDLSAPRGTFPEVASSSGITGIIPTDYDPAKPDSTGPWVFDSYNPGVEVKMSRYDGYHGTPAKLKSLSLVALPDSDAYTNALTSGQVDAGFGIDAINLPRIESDPNLKVLDVPTSGFQVVTMRVDQGPTADQRVREALRLAVDREQINTVVNAGHGRIGNDLYGIDDPNYRSDLVRTRDVEKAKALVKEAGAEGASMTLYTILTGEPMAQIVAQNAREIGLNVNVEVRDDAVYYSDGYLDYDFAMDIWPGVSILNVAGTTGGPNATLNYTHSNDPEFIALYDLAAGTLDPAVRTEALSKMQQILFDRGGFIIPTFPSMLHVVPTATTGWAEKDPSGGGLFLRSIAQVSWT